MSLGLFDLKEIIFLLCYIDYLYRLEVLMKFFISLGSY